MNARTRSLGILILAVAVAGCATTPARIETELFTALPAGKAAYFGVDTESAGVVLRALLPEDGRLEQLTDRVTRIVGYFDAGGEVGIIAYGRFSRAAGRIALRRSGFDRTDAPDWAPRRSAFRHPQLGVNGVVVEPGVLVIATSPPRELIEAYGSAIRPFGPGEEAADFPVSLVASADGAVVARFDRLSATGPLAAIPLQTAAMWVFRSAEDLFAVDATIWFRGERGTGAYRALLRLALANWLTARLGMEPERVRGGLSVEGGGRSLSVTLPPLTPKELADIVASLAPSARAGSIGTDGGE